MLNLTILRRNTYAGHFYGPVNNGSVMFNGTGPGEMRQVVSHMTVN